MQGQQLEDPRCLGNPAGFAIHGTVLAVRHDEPGQLLTCDEQIKADSDPADWEKSARNRSLFSG